MPLHAPEWRGVSPFPCNLKSGRVSAPKIGMNGLLTLVPETTKLLVSTSFYVPAVSKIPMLPLIVLWFVISESQSESHLCPDASVELLSHGLKQANEKVIEASPARAGSHGFSVHRWPRRLCRKRTIFCILLDRPIRTARTSTPRPTWLLVGSFVRSLLPVSRAMSPGITIANCMRRF